VIEEKEKEAMMGEEPQGREGWEVFIPSAGPIGRIGVEDADGGKG
jgi:hypothetical protein